MGILGLSFTGVGIDYIRHIVTPANADGTPAVTAPQLTFGVGLPLQWEPMHVLLLLAGIILGLALMRAVLNYAYAVAVNVLVHKKLVLDLRSEVYDKLQRLSFRFFDANTTGSIMNLWCGFPETAGLIDRQCRSSREAPSDRHRCRPPRIAG